MFEFVLAMCVLLGVGAFVVQVVRRNAGPKSSAAPSKRCLHCGTRLNDGECPACDDVPAAQRGMNPLLFSAVGSAVGRDRDGFNKLRQLLSDLKRRGQISPDAFGRLIDAVRHEETLLTDTAPRDLSLKMPPAAPPAPATAELPTVAPPLMPWPTATRPVAPPQVTASQFAATQLTPPPVTAPAATSAPEDLVVSAELVTPTLVPAPEPTYAVAAEPAPIELAPIEAILIEPVSVSDRAKTYEASRQRAATEASAATRIPTAPPAPPRARWTELLATFMEERNVRWGELVGGLLIVGCSVALVISFWSQIAARPMLKFGLFNSVAAALFALGFYVDKKWKLPTTSRGVLAIATLLVPLNFLSIAAFSRGTAMTDPLVIGGEVLSIGLFSALLFLAGRLITAPAPWALMLGVMGPAIAQLLTRRWIGPDSSTTLLCAMGTWPLACHAIAVGAIIARSWRSKELAETEIHALLRMVGLTFFAALPPCGLLLMLTENVPGTLARVAPLLILGGAPSLCAGLLMWQRIADRAHSGFRVAGTAIAVFGSLVMLAGIALSWPQPGAMLLAASINFVVFTVVALLFEIPAAHLLAGGAATLGFLIAVNVTRGTLGWTSDGAGTTAQALLSAVSGNALTAFSLVYIVATAIAARLRRKLDAIWLAVVAGLSAIASIALVTLFGFGREGDPNGTTWLFGFWSLVGLTLSLGSAAYGAMIPDRWRRLPIAVAWLSAGLLAACLIQGLVFLPFDEPWLAAPLTTAAVVHSLVMVLAACLAQWLADRRSQTAIESQAVTRFSPVADSVMGSLRGAGLFASVVATLMTLSDVTGMLGEASLPLHTALHLAVLSLVWLLAAVLRSSTPLFAMFQSGLYAAAAFAGLNWVQGQSWYQDSSLAWFDPRTLQLQGCILAAISLAWQWLRAANLHIAPLETSQPNPTLTRWWSRLRSLVRTSDDPIAVDRFAAACALLLLLILASYSVMPGVMQELAPQSAVQRIAASQPNDVVNLADGRVVPLATTFELPRMPHLPARELGSWILLGILAAYTLSGFWERISEGRVIALMVLLCAVAPLVAAHAEGQVAVASALRWMMIAVAVVIAVGYWSRDGVSRAVAHIGWTGDQGASNLPASVSLFWAMALGIGATLLSAQTLGMLVAQDPVVGPDPTSFFLQWGQAVNQALPVGIFALLLVGCAVRERSQGIAFAGALTANVCATMAFLFAIATPGVVPTAVEKIGTRVLLLELNAIVAASFAILWWIAQVFAARRSSTYQNSTDQNIEKPRVSLYLTSLAAISLLLTGLAIQPGLTDLIVNPFGPAGVSVLASRPMGCAALALSLIACFVVITRKQPLPTIALSLITLLSVVSLAGLFAINWDTGNWLAYHTLILGYCLVPPLMLAGGVIWWRNANLSLNDPRLRATAFAGALAIVCVVLVALRDLRASDPDALWWSPLPLWSAAVSAVLITLWSCRRRYLYLAFGLTLMAGVIWSVDATNPLRPATPGTGVGAWIVYVNQLLLAAPIPLWLAIELKRVRPARQAASGLESSVFGSSVFGWPVHRPALWLALSSSMVLTAISVLADLVGEHFPTTPVWNAAALVALALATITCLWDERAASRVFSLYVLGLICVGRYVDMLDFERDRVLWWSAVALGAFTLAASYLWSRREALKSTTERLGIVWPPSRFSHAWYVPLTAGLVLGVVAIVFVIEQTSTQWQLRVTAAQAAVVQGFALALLAKGRPENGLRYAALVVGTLGAIAIGWSQVPPDALHPVLDRSVATCVALIASAIVAGLGFKALPARATQWIEVAQRFVPALIVALSVSVIAVLGQELNFALNDLEVPMTWPAILAVAVSLLALTLTALAAAVLPGRDPFNLSETGRMTYVYVAEGILALLFLHIRLTMPWLFGGAFVKYWPLVVMAIAFLGVGLSEFFRRRGQNVLAQPIERTGILLPLLPVLGFWFLPNASNYTVVLLVVGSLYAVLAVTRRSFGFGLLAALAANGGLWHYLSQIEGLGLLEHPQLWLIPPAGCVLAAAYLNRDRLSAAQMTMIRYLTSMTIYLASTADIFINGVAQAPWLIFVLAGLSLVGIALGIMIRVRAFLFLGLSFLVMSIVTMIYHAAVDLEQTWIWAASGIAVGVMLLVLGGLFEKKRQDVLRLVDDLKQWQA